MAPSNGAMSPFFTSIFDHRIRAETFAQILPPPSVKDYSKERTLAFPEWISTCGGKTDALPCPSL